MPYILNITDNENEKPSIENEEIVIVPPIQYNRYGWNIDKEDDRDFRINTPENITFARSFTLREKMPPILNQGKLGSCTANGICNAIRFCEVRRDCIAVLCCSQINDARTEVVEN